MSSYESFDGDSNLTPASPTKQLAAQQLAKRTPVFGGNQNGKGPIDHNMKVAATPHSSLLLHHAKQKIILYPQTKSNTPPEGAGEQFVSRLWGGQPVMRPAPPRLHKTITETELICGSKESPGYRANMEDCTEIRQNFLTLRVLNGWRESIIPAEVVRGSHGRLNHYSNQPETEDMTIGLHSFHFIAVFDGHGGVEVAQRLKDDLPAIMIEFLEAFQDNINNDKAAKGMDELSYPGSLEVHDSCESTYGKGTDMDIDGDDISSVPAHSNVHQPLRLSEVASTLKNAFIETNRRLPTVTEKTVGSTAVVSMISAHHIIIANVGDSRAVLMRDGVSLRLSRDHKPDQEDEERRIRQSGGRIWDFNGRRVMGLLAMTRAFGDDCLQPYGITADPEVTILPRTQEDDFLILACDGLWDVISDEEACSLVQRCFKRAQERNATRVSACRVAANVLFRAAFSNGSNDNISVVVVDLRTGNYPIDE